MKVLGLNSSKHVFCKAKHLLGVTENELTDCLPPNTVTRVSTRPAQCSQGGPRNGSEVKYSLLIMCKVCGFPSVTRARSYQPPCHLPLVSELTRVHSLRRREDLSSRFPAILNSVMRGCRGAKHTLRLGNSAVAPSPPHALHSRRDGSGEQGPSSKSTARALSRK